MRNSWKRRAAMKNALGLTIAQHNAFGGKGKELSWGINERGLNRMKMGRKF